MEREGCNACGGTQFTWKDGVRTSCWKCAGTGYITTVDVPCNRCYGNGKIDMGFGVMPMECPTCKGSGAVKESGR